MSNAKQTHEAKNNNSSAAAMDALNLDDLFNDDPNDTFFEGMDMDLGDISGVFNEGSGDVMSQEFGRGESNGSRARPAMGAVGGGIQSSAHQSVGKKRGSKVALTHAQIMANLGIKKEVAKVSKPAAVPLDKDEGTITQRIRTRRETRFTEVDGAASKSGGSKISSKREAVAKQETNIEVSKATQVAVDAVGNYGIRPSTDFYPYMRLPHEVEVKKGQKVRLQ